MEAAGYSIKDDYWFADEGISGNTHTSQRPAFNKLLGKLRKNDNDVIVCCKIDRLGRDAINVLDTINRLSDMGVKVIVLQLGNTDLTSSAGRLLLTMLSAVAEMERSLLIERTQAGLARAKAEGKILGRPSKTSQEQQQVIIKQLNEGTSVSAIAREFKISRATVIGIRNRV
jgi:DNA invertase Pin-like site-specific DNA recombinase